jgi:short-subunit dehydrogenase
MMSHPVAMITGASSGLGRALAKELNQQGYKLFLTARNHKALLETQAQCAHPDQIQVHAADITDSEALAQLFEKVNEMSHLDVLVLNAGKTMWANFEDLDDTQAIETLMKVNFTAQVQCVQHALPLLKKTSGQIVGISSLQGKIGVPYHTGYVASKHALSGFLNALRLELKNQVRVLVVYPSWLKGTNLRENGIRSQNLRVSAQHERGTSVARCSRLIANAMKKNKNELFVPWYYQFLPFLAWICPGLLDRLVIKKTRKNVQFES